MDTRRGTLEGEIEDRRAEEILAAKEKVDKRLLEGSGNSKLIDNSPPR